MDRSLRQSQASNTWAQYITDEGSKPEILSRIAQATAALTRLKPVWTDKSIFSDASKHSARASVWTSNGTVIAKLTNGRTLKLDIHTNVNVAFRRAMAGHENIDEVELLDSSNA